MNDTMENQTGKETPRMVKAYEKKFGPMNESPPVLQKTMINFFERMQKPGASARKELPIALLEALQEAGMDLDSKDTDEIIEKVRDELNLGPQEKTKEKPTQTKDDEKTGIRQKLKRQQKTNLLERIKKEGGD